MTSKRLEKTMFRSTLVLFISLAFIMLPLDQLQATEPEAFRGWAQSARLGGAAVWASMSDAQIHTLLDDLLAQKVSVVEADSNLSSYLTDAQFEQAIAFMRRFAAEVHKRGMRVVWYYPALEVVTQNGKNIAHTMAKDHPDWLQIGLDRVTPNVFYGGGGQVFWVDADAESAWMSPSSEAYRNYFIERIRRIVRSSGIDGLWLDVPLYADFGPVKWSDFNPEAIARYKADTGFNAPTQEDWQDSNWKRWISWRHEELARFLADVTAAVRALNPDFPVFAETLPTDYNGGTIYGLDGGYLKDIEGLTHVWEVDTMSNNVGMRNAREDDWVSFISALKYTRAASGDSPSWAFSYGKQEDDALQVMAQVLIAGNNPYELMVPEMTTTVGADFRTRMFEWVKTNSAYLFNAKSGAKVAILYSSPSRDFVDQFQGLGMFATTDSDGDALWWAEGENDSAYNRDYLAEHRGMVKLLVNEHIPFNILVRPDADELAAYDVVILPNVQALPDSQASLLRQYVADGGHLLVTGPNPGGMNDFGVHRSEYALADVLNITNNAELPSEQFNTFGEGGAYYFAELLGKDYFATSNTSARQKLADTLRTVSSPPVTIDSDDRIHLELAFLGEQTILQFANFVGVDGSFSVLAQTISVELEIPEDKQVSQVALTSPNSQALSLEPIAFTQTGQQISFDVSVDQYAMIIVSFADAQSPITNHGPVAGVDYLKTGINTPISFDHPQLLSNDGDLDNDVLTVKQVESIAATLGTLSDQGEGVYRYTPPADFVGKDKLTYIIEDGKGGKDIGQISIEVVLPSQVFYPQSINISTGSFDYGSLASFTTVDEDTYDIRSVSEANGFVVDWQASTTMEQVPTNITAIEVTKLGQYSQAGVLQTFYLYNFQSGTWELFDSSFVGNEDDFPVVVLIDNQIADYISEAGELRARIRGVYPNSEMVSWSNALHWTVSSWPEVAEEKAEDEPVEEALFEDEPVLDETAEDESVNEGPSEEARSSVNTGGGTLSLLCLLTLCALRIFRCQSNTQKTVQF